MPKINRQKLLEYLETELEAPEVRSIMVTLVRNIVDLNQTVDQAMRKINL